jgi:outer membrane lipoprotein SlyB
LTLISFLNLTVKTTLCEYPTLHSISNTMGRISMPKAVQTYRFIITFILVLSLAIGSLYAQQTQTAQSAKRGAFWGGVAGLVFGGSLGDVVAGAAVGGAGGAAYGYAKGNERQKRSQLEIQDQALRLEQERNYVLQGQANKTRDQMAQDHDLLVRAFGEDNVNGLNALVQCKHRDAYLYALAGANSDYLSHRLAAGWLEALVAQDQKDGVAAERAYMQLVAQDDTVGSVDQARDETIDVLVEVRAERSAQGIQCRS